LAPGGAVCFHASNRYLDLTGVLDNVARDLRVASAVLRAQPGPPNNDPGFFASEWIVLTRSTEALRKWTSNEGFERRDDPKMQNPQANPPRALAKLIWTDEHASVLSAVRPNLAWPKLIYGILVMLLFFGVFLGLIEIAFAMMPR
jgi:hypothetical protein